MIQSIQDFYQIYSGLSCFKNLNQFNMIELDKISSKLVILAQCFLKKANVSTHPSKAKLCFLSIQISDYVSACQQLFTQKVKSCYLSLFFWKLKSCTF